MGGRWPCYPRSQRRRASSGSCPAWSCRTISTIPSLLLNWRLGKVASERHPARYQRAALVGRRFGPDRAGGGRDLLADRSHRLVISAASAWEISIKTRLGCLDGESLLSAWNEILESYGAEDLAVDSADAALAGRLAWEHRDPFDRMLVAQAVRRSLTIATSDRRMIDGALTPVIDTRA